MTRLCCSLLLLAAATPALAQDPPPAEVPAPVRALSGCWSGAGEVMGKPVVIALAARPITEGAMFLVEAESHATAEPKDRYAAHLVFGGRTAEAAGEPAKVSGFWIDSFGGDFTAQGEGTVRPEGFDIDYGYSTQTFINRWRLAGAALTWTITSRRLPGKEAPFASYRLERTACAGTRATKP